MVDYIQTGFNGGIISPDVYGQVDISKYSSGAEEIKNFVCTPKGPLQNRSGTEFINGVKTSSQYARLIPFMSSAIDSQIIEMGAGYARFYKDGARVESQHLARNGDMNIDSYWYDEGPPTTNERSTTEYYSKYYSRHIVTASTGHGAYTAPSEFILLPNTKYDFGLRIYPDVTTINITVKYILPTVTVYTNDFTITAGAWNLITGTFTTGAIPIRQGWLYVITTAAHGAADFYIDDFYMLKTDTCEIVTEYLEDDIRSLDFAQSVDEIYLAAQQLAPHEIRRYAYNHFQIDDITSQALMQSIRNANYTWTLSGSGTNEYYLRDASAADPEINKPGGLWGNIFPFIVQEGDIGSLDARQWGYGDNDTLGYNTIYYRSASGADPDSFAVDSIKYYVYPHEWNADNGYPGTVVFHADRKTWGGSPANSEMIWMSMSSIYDDHTVSDIVIDSDALKLNIGNGEINYIIYLRSLRGMIGLTIASEYYVTGADGSALITAISKRASVGSSSGSARIRPLIIDNELLHVQRHAKVLKTLVYDFNSDSFYGDELTVFAEHLTRTFGIVEMAYQRSPYKIIWCARSDGALLGLTYYPQQKVWGWHQHDVGGDVESVAVIPGSGYDELWMAVKREVNGSTVRYIERLRPFFVKPEWDVDYFMDDDTTDAIFLDSSLTLDNRIAITGITAANPAVVSVDTATLTTGDTVRIRTVKGMTDPAFILKYDASGLPVYGQSGVNGFDFTLANVGGGTAELVLDGTPLDATTFAAYVSGGTLAKKVTTISGLGHWEGETVGVVGDGMEQSEKVVSAASITLDESASVVHVGQKYNSDLKTLPPRLSDQVNTFQMHQKKISNYSLRILETSGFSIGRDKDHLSEVGFVDGSVPAGHPAPLVTQDTKESSFSGNYSTRPSMFIRQSSPMPCTISSIIMQIEV